jgi:hypothetical protein
VTRIVVLFGFNRFGRQRRVPSEFLKANKTISYKIIGKKLGKADIPA